MKKQKVFTLIFEKEKLDAFIKDWELVNQVIQISCTFRSQEGKENALVTITAIDDESEKIITTLVFGEKGFLTEKGWKLLSK